MATRSVAVKVVCDKGKSTEADPAVRIYVMDGGKYLTLPWDDHTNCPTQDDAARHGSEPTGQDPYCFAALKWDVVYFVLVYADGYASRVVRVDQKVDIPLLTIHLRKLR